MVLFAYDGSDPAKSAIREAGRQLSSGRRGLVLSVWEPLAAQLNLPNLRSPMGLFRRWMCWMHGAHGAPCRLKR